MFDSGRDSVSLITKIMVTFFKIPIIYISIAYQLSKEYLYIFRNLDKNPNFALAKSFFHGMMVGSLKFSFNYSFFNGFLFWLMIPKVKEPGHVRSESNGLYKIIFCLVMFICCGLPLLKWRHNTITTYGQNLSIVLIQLQILITFHLAALPRFLGIAANTLAPLIWAVASRLIHIFICMCSYLHQKCTN